jgi:hypothetical protein
MAFQTELQDLLHFAGILERQWCMNKYKPYSVACPPYEITSGGIRVMYALQSWLEIKGQISLMNARFDIPFVGIYPEIYHGNPLGAQRVVRYILQKPGVMAMHGVPSPTTFDPRDDIYVFSRIYDTFGVNEDHLLFLPVINLHIFKDLHKKRTKTCYLVGKGTNTHQHPEGSIELTRQFANDQSALAELLNECSVLYGYDHLSAMYDIARLCGCPVKYFGSGSRRELQYYEPGLEGIDFGYGDFVSTTSDLFRQRYEKLREDFSHQLDIFIEDTQHEKN